MGRPTKEDPKKKNTRCSECSYTHCGLKHEIDAIQARLEAQQNKTHGWKVATDSARKDRDRWRERRNILREFVFKDCYDIPGAKEALAADEKLGKEGGQ